MKFYNHSYKIFKMSKPADIIVYYIANFPLVCTGTQNVP